MEYVVLDGKRVPITGWRDVPKVKKPALSEVDWGKVPVRAHRPTTVAERERRRFLHEPFTKTKCTCGDEYRNPADLLEHLKLWMRSWRRVRFRYVDKDGEQFAKPMIGHYMRFRPSPQKGWGQIHCLCGWQSESRRIRHPGPAAREHVRAVVRQRLGLEGTPATKDESGPPSDRPRE